MKKDVDFQVSVIIPCYKTPEGLLELVSEITSELSNGFSFEILLISDGSDLQTWRLIKECSRSFEYVKGILLGKNVGQHRATLFGISMAKGKIIITMDDDGQHNPGGLRERVDEFKSGYFDVLYFTPSNTKESLYRKLTSSVSKSFLAKLGIIPHARMISSYRIINTRCLSKNSQSEMLVGNVDALLSQLTTRFHGVPTEFRKRTNGKSNYSTFKLITHLIDFMFKTKDAPMIWISLFGATGFLFSSIFSVWTFVGWLVGKIQVQGYTTIVMFNSMAFSLMFFILGVMGKVVVNSQVQKSEIGEVWVREVT